MMRRFLSAVLALLAATSASAQVYAPPQVGVNEVTVDFFLLNLDSVSEKDETFDADLYLVSDVTPEAGDMLNHSCEPNCGLLGQTLIIAMRDIGPGEELCFDYATCDASDYDEFRCRCGQPNCREIITGSDWREPGLQEKYAGWFSPYLARRIAALPARPS